MRLPKVLISCCSVHSQFAVWGMISCTAVAQETNTNRQSQQELCCWTNDLLVAPSLSSQPLSLALKKKSTGFSSSFVYIRENTAFTQEVLLQKVKMYWRTDHITLSTVLCTTWSHCKICLKLSALFIYIVCKNIVVCGLCMVLHTLHLSTMQLYVKN